MTQKDIDNKLWRLQTKMRAVLLEVEDFKKEIQKLKNIEMGLDDPHALIPKEYKDVEEWLKANPVPDAVFIMKFPNKATARNAQLACNNYQEYYHIVKIIK